MTATPRRPAIPRPPLRRLAGTVMLLALVTAYPFLVLLVSVPVLPRAGSLGQLAFYVIAGFIWVPPAAWIISWMHRKATKQH